MEKLKTIKVKKRKKPTKQTDLLLIKSQKFEKIAIGSIMNWIWQGACQSAGEREWPASGHDQDHRERHHRMLYSVTEKRWREEKRGRCLLVTCWNLRILYKKKMNTK